MEKILFKTSTKYTFEEHKKFSYMISFELNKVLIKVVTIDVCLLLLSLYYTKVMFGISLILLIMSLVFPLIIYFTINENIKASFKTNKLLKDMEIEVNFYEDKVEYSTKLVKMKVPYNYLYKKIETKTNYYLMTSRNSGILIDKSNCDKGLIEFLNKLEIKNN